MPKKPKSVEEHFEIIENLLIGIILKRKPNIKDVAKIVVFRTNGSQRCILSRKKAEKEMEPRG